MRTGLLTGVGGWEFYDVVYGFYSGFYWVIYCAIVMF